jgi:hypothetical protein
VFSRKEPDHGMLAHLHVEFGMLGGVWRGAGVGGGWNVLGGGGGGEGIGRISTITASSRISDQAWWPLV